jgi:hypothetical protein
MKGPRAESFNNWNKVYNMVLNKEHLDRNGLDKVRAIAKGINLSNSLNTKVGSAKS